MIFRKTKICSMCQKRKSRDRFGANKSRKDGLQFYCKICVQLSDRNDKLKYKFGITLIQYLYLYFLQKGCCALCGIAEKFFKHKLGVDHVHGERGPDAVRGLLCGPCNGWLLPMLEKVPALQNDLVQKYLKNRPLCRVVFLDNGNDE